MLGGGGAHFWPLSINWALCKWHNLLEYCWWSCPTHSVPMTRFNRAPLGCVGTEISIVWVSINQQQLCDAIVSIWTKRIVSSIFFSIFHAWRIRRIIKTDSLTTLLGTSCKHYINCRSAKGTKPSNFCNKVIICHNDLDVEKLNFLRIFTVTHHTGRLDGFQWKGWAINGFRAVSLFERPFWPQNLTLDPTALPKPPCSDSPH